MEINIVRTLIIAASASSLASSLLISANAYYYIMVIEYNHFCRKSPNVIIIIKSLLKSLKGIPYSMSRAYWEPPWLPCGWNQGSADATEDLRMPNGIDREAPEKA